MAEPSRFGRGFLLFVVILSIHSTTGAVPTLRLAVAMLLSTIVDKIAEHERALRTQFVR